MEQVSVVYDGIAISYVERENVWCFELRGRERRVESLAKAKEAIDRPVSAKVKPFERIPAISGGSYGSGFKYGEVTSIADGGYRSTVQVWFVANGDRSKETASLLYADSKENREIIAQINAMEAERDMLAKKITHRRGTLARFVIEVPE